MKKLLSICFLSILLGLLSFSTSAQSNFWIENLQPETITGVANAAGGNLVLDNVLNPAVVGNTDLYELHFCPTGADANKRVSIDWLLYRDGQLVNENLSAYADFYIYTLYPELNQQGQCQSIHWLGGQMPNNYGFCNAPTQADMFSGWQCNTPTNYPGAMPVSQGTPGQTITNYITMETAPAMGFTPIYTEALDYFYANFLAQTRTVVQIKWKQVGNYALVMRVRERVGGTDWNNLTWGESETQYIGGHMSCCGNIIASDSIHYLVKGSFSKEVCDNTTFEYGRPVYTFNEDLSNRNVDTLIVFGDLIGEGACEHFQVERLDTVHFYVRHTPIVAAQNANLCKCDVFGMEQLLALITMDQRGLDATASATKLQWYYRSGLQMKWNDTPPTISTAIGEHSYMVRQVNTYNDTLVCEGPAVTFTVTFSELEAPVLVGPAQTEYCLEAIDANTMLNVASTPDESCASTTLWYSNLSRPLYYESMAIGNLYSSYIDTNTFVFKGNNLNVNLQDYMPSVNKDTVIYFFAVSYGEAANCTSKMYSYFTVTLHQTPELAAVTTPDSLNCLGAEVTMKVKINNNPDLTDADYTYRWTNVTEMLVNGERVVANPEVESTVTGVATSSFDLPFNPVYNNTYSQQIFTNEEVAAGKITKVAFDWAVDRNLTKNIQIYLSTTDQSYFNTSTRAWFPQGVKVYDGTFSFGQPGWNEIELQTPYDYDATQNLVVTVAVKNAHTASGAMFRGSRCDGNMVMYWRSDLNSSYIDNPNSIPSNSRRYQNYRSNIRFTVEGEIPSTAEKNQEAYNVIPDTALCGDQFTSSVFVVDANGCKSDVVTFNYAVGDTVAPVVTPAAYTTVVNTCDAEAFPAAFATVEAFNASNIAEVTDNCNLISMTSQARILSTADTTCQLVMERVYTFKDSCGNTATFTHTIIGRDSVAPEFTNDRPIRVFPVPAGDCKFNSPDSMTFVNAIAPYVYDNCTDSAYLMSTVAFTWENNTESPIGATNIFRERNHLTVAVTITDRCGNSTTELQLFLDRPDTLDILPNAIIFDRNICFNDTINLEFLDSKIVDDTVSGPFVPYTYAWSEVNGKPVEFTNVNGTVTGVVAPAAGDYEFVMTVTNAIGCSAVSDPVFVHVRNLPTVTIEPVVLNGATEPYCPTYGNLTIEAVSHNLESYQAIMDYTWSGESVNNMPHTNSTWITIIPEWCDTVYTAKVVVTDDLGCMSEATRTFTSQAQAPAFISTIPDTTVNISEGCKLLVPDFKDLVTREMISDNCYSFSEITAKADWYKQVPAAGTVFTADTQVVTITVKNPCGAVTTTTVNALKPADYISVSIAPLTQAECQETIELDGVDYNATATRGDNVETNVTWSWKEVGGTTVLSTSDVLTIQEALEAGEYEYQVTVTDVFGCQASATANLTVFYQGDDIHTRIWPSTMCERNNGIISVDTVPSGFYVILWNDIYGPVTKRSDVPLHPEQQLPWNTIVFDSLAAGDYNVAVVTLDGCERSTVVTVGSTIVLPAPPVYTVEDVTVCADNNGRIILTQEAGYTYTLVKDGEVLTSYEGLSHGTYTIIKTDVMTHCATAVNVFVGMETEDEVFVATSTANTNCTEPNGTITLKTPGLQYEIHCVETSGYEYTTGVIAADTTITGLVNGSYSITVYNPVTGCYGEGSVRVNDGRTYPNIQVSTTNNQFCVNDYADTVNGSIKINNKTAYASYVLYNSDNDSIADQTSANNVWTSLPAGTYSIIAYTPNNCQVTKTNINITNETVTPHITYITHRNDFCDSTLFNGSVKLVLNKRNGSLYSPISAKGFRVVGNNYDSLQLVNGNNAVFAGLNSGTYNVTAVSTFNCPATNTFTIDQYAIDEISLVSTPDHFCAPTFEKPGNGTVTVLKPVHSATDSRVFMYYFYDADDVDMDVPYELPMTTTKYWLAHGDYHVVAFEPATGCSIDDYINVAWEPYTVNFEVETTPSYTCSQVNGNGTLTVVNPTSTNPEPVFTYSIDGVNFTTNPVFTNLVGTEYTVTVKDTTSSCTFERVVAVPTADSCAPVITISDNFGVGEEFHYCYGTEGIMLTANAVDTCDNVQLEYSWYAPCADPSTSSTAVIPVQTDHYVVNGCDYILTVHNPVTGCDYNRTVRVYIHPNPELYLTINGREASTTHPNSFCENDSLTITVHNRNFEELDVESIQWTLGYVGTGVQTINVVGTDYANDNVTFCVRAANTFGCMSGITSIPVNFKRIDRVSVVETACERYTLPGSNGVVVLPQGQDYPYTTTREISYTSVTKGCDSIVTYTITLIGAPTVTPNHYEVPAFCETENKTLADFNATFVPDWNGSEGDVKWMCNGVELPETTEIDYEFASTHNNVTRVFTNDCGTVSAGIEFEVSKAPAIDSFALATSYCNNEAASLKFRVSTFGTPATATLTFNGATVGTYNVTAENQEFTYNFTPRYYTHNGQSITLTVANNNGLCAEATASGTFRVDTTIYTIAAKTYCEGDILHFSDFVTGDFTNVSIYSAAQVPDGLSDGMAVPYALNNANIFFTMQDHCGNTVTTNTVIVTVNPQPRLTVDELPTDLCINDAAAALENAIHTEFADEEHWIVNMPNDPMPMQFTSAESVVALIKDNPNANVAYYVKNDCGTKTVNVGTFRIHDRIEVSTSDVTVCPNVTPTNLLLAVQNVTSVTNYGNYDQDQVSLSYTIVRNGVVMAPESAAPFQMNDSVRVVVATPNPNCGADTVYSKVTVKTNSYTTPVYQAACSGAELSAFVATQPSWTGTASVTASGWKTCNNADGANATDATASTVVTDAADVYVSYTWTTECGETFNTPWTKLTVNNVPVVSLNDEIEICEGNAITLDQAGLTVNFHGNADKYDTAWTVDGNAFDFATVLTSEQYNGKKLVVTLNDNGEACGIVRDTLTLVVNPLPDPTIAGPERACAGESITILAELGFTNYVFNINGVEQDPQAGNSFTTIASMQGDEIGVEYTTVTVTVTDANGCVGTSSESAVIKVTNAPEFIFTNENGVETHNFTAQTGEYLNYTWMVGTECFNPDTLVYVEYDIYYNGVKIADNQIGEYLATQTLINPLDPAQSPSWVTSNTMSWLSGDGTPLTNTSYFNYAVSNPSSATSGNHFPSSNLGLSNNNVYDDLWMHFLANRPVDAQIVPFRLAGEYKVVYRLMATSNNNDFQHPYTNENGEQQHIGGQNSMVSTYVRTLLVTDSIIINVTGESMVAQEPVTELPVVAPAITGDEAVIVPEMEVWPNPAPAITTTFKARVHNMSGEATVTITSLAGKQIYTGKIFIDNDNYYFESNVDNLSLGSYIMTVRTADAVVTKKLVVMVSSK